ncbi:MAG: hypothetical protein HC921_19045 [Synechococcaceae cyanobacterium SM2_3_1]|nr:hypothetical protein [Synechococcaceae cyanobacterium SM2_3_1]
MQLTTGFAGSVDIATGSYQVGLGECDNVSVVRVINATIQFNDFAEPSQNEAFHAIAICDQSATTDFGIFNNTIRNYTLGGVFAQNTEVRGVAIRGNIFTDAVINEVAAIVDAQTLADGQNTPFDEASITDNLFNEVGTYVPGQSVIYQALNPLTAPVPIPGTPGFNSLSGEGTILVAFKSDGGANRIRHLDDVTNFTTPGFINTPGGLELPGFCGRDEFIDVNPGALGNGLVTPSLLNFVDDAPLPLGAAPFVASPPGIYFDTQPGAYGFQNSGLCETLSPGGNPPLNLADGIMFR